jgi:hypothetical protein
MRASNVDAPSFINSPYETNPSDRLGRFNQNVYEIWCLEIARPAPIRRLLFVLAASLVLLGKIPCWEKNESTNTLNFLGELRQ